MATTVASVRALLAGVVDYAGLFPPAKLEMQRAVENYAGYRQGPDAWALGRFIVPAGCLDEFSRAADAHLPRNANGSPWRLSALGGGALALDVERIVRFNAEHADLSSGAAVIDALEFKADDPAAVRAAAALLPPTVIGYAELALGGSLGRLVAAVRDAGLRAKVRTGGVTPDAFPTAAALADFIAECTGAGVPFKATAGLHHALRARYRLTYEPDSIDGPMFGFLNVFVAAAFARVGADVGVLRAVLQSAASHDFRFTPLGVSWRDLHVTTSDLRDLRRSGAIAFGSCSFTEPLADLAALSLR